MVRFSLFCLFAFCILTGGAFSSVMAAEKKAHARLFRVEDFGPNPGNLAMYKYLPKRKPGKKAPLIVALHGCGGSAKQFSAAGFNQLAEKYRFYVLYPEQKPGNNNIRCFNHSRPNLAEMRERESESVLQMVNHMVSKHRINRQAIFIAGFSSGGQFANILAASYPETFRAAAIIGAGGYFCKPGHTGIPGFIDCDAEEEDDAEYAPFIIGPRPARWPNISIWHGALDKNVPYDTLRLAVAQWKTVHHIARKPQQRKSLPDDIAYESYKTSKGKVLIESYSMTSRAHTVPVTEDCGVPGGDFSLAKVCFARRAIQFFGIR